MATVDKQLRVMEEIISTETTYVEELATLIEVYINPLREKNIMDRDGLQAIFSNWELLHGFNTHLLNELNKDKDGPAGVKGVAFGQIFKAFSHFFKMYSVYLQNYENALQQVSLMSQRSSAFDRLIQEGSMHPRCRGKTLISYLIMPVQRIPRYKMLLEELSKRTPAGWFDRQNLTEALEAVANAARDNNEKIRQRENKMKILDIQTHFDSGRKPVLFDDPAREFIREGPLTKLCRRGPKEFFFWLFSDKLVYGQSSGVSTFSFHRDIDLRCCRVTADMPQSEDAPTQNVDRAFVIDSTTKSFIVWAQSPSEKNEWVEEISTAIEKLREDSGDPMAPVWQPDGSTNNCEVCKSQFTLLRRRHHCRNCGDLICSQCSSHKLVLPHISERLAQRVCDRCYDEREEIAKGNGSRGANFERVSDVSSTPETNSMGQAQLLASMRGAPPVPTRMQSGPPAISLECPSPPPPPPGPLARRAASSARQPHVLAKAPAPPRPPSASATPPASRVANLSHRIDANAPPPPRRTPPAPPVNPLRRYVSSSPSRTPASSMGNGAKANGTFVAPRNFRSTSSPSVARGRSGAGRPNSSQSEGPPTRTPPRLPQGTSSASSTPAGSPRRGRHAADDSTVGRTTYNGAVAARQYTSSVTASSTVSDDDLSAPRPVSWRPSSSSSTASVPSRTPADRPPPQRPAPASLRLPDGWQRHETAEGLEYYHNLYTGSTQWERPNKASSAPPKPARGRSGNAAKSRSPSGARRARSPQGSGVATYDYDQLAVPRHELPSDVNPNEREMHLDDFQFQYYFFCSKEEFQRLPQWKRINKKKEMHLF